MGTTLTNTYSISPSLSDESTESTAPADEQSKQVQSLNGLLVPAILAGFLIHPIANIPTNAIPDYSIGSYYGQIGQQNEIDFEESINEIIGSYQGYHANWDGYNGIPPSADTVNDALSFLAKLPFGVIEPRPGLSGDGEISLFWEYDDVFVDIGFIGDSKYTLYARDRQSIEYFKDEIDLKDALPEALLNLIYMK